MPYKKRARERREPGDLLTIPAFCKANAISLSLYFRLKRKGAGPRETRIGRRVMISPEAEAEWRRRHEGGHADV